MTKRHERERRTRSPREKEGSFRKMRDKIVEKRLSTAKNLCKWFFSPPQSVLMFAATTIVKACALLHGLIARKTRCQAAGAKLRHKGRTSSNWSLPRKEKNTITLRRDLKGRNKKTRGGSSPPPRRRNRNIDLCAWSLTRLPTFSIVSLSSLIILTNEIKCPVQFENTVKLNLIQSVVIKFNLTMFNF